MRPSQPEIVSTLRASLNDTVAPAVTDRWARYVVTAMDLVFQHLERRMTGEATTLEEDNADMMTTLSAIVGHAVTAGQDSSGDRAARWSSLADLSPTELSDDPHTANEELRSAVVAVLGWADEQASHLGDDATDEVRDLALRLVRRQVDRVAPFVEPLHMEFGPAVSSR